MPAGFRLRLVLSIFVVAAAVGGIGQALTVPFRTQFGLDTVGLPPALGGDGQPTAMNVPAGASVTVVDSALGLEAQPVELDSPNGAATWLNWNLVPAVSDLGVEVRFSVSFASAFNGVFFDASGPGGIRVRLRTNAAGELLVSDGCVDADLGGFSPGTPIAVVVLFAPPAGFWVVADGEGDGFDDDVPVEGTSCNGGDLTALHVYAWGSLGDAATVAFDDLLVRWIPIFLDDFESGGTALWSLALP